MRSILIAVYLGCLSGLSAGDWPMWRYDAARSAASPDEIAAKPVLLWSRHLPPVRPAWPLEPNQRINFDASYEPVVMGKLLFLGSPNDGSVTAYDTETGAEKWKFFTEGPVRCALACWKGKVLAGSDDGCLYCLDGQSGRVLWKFRGAPAARPDRRQLGNEHLVSFWPVRGGPVVKDGVVYFGAGIWPIFGVFLHALDAETGSVKWSNGELNYIGSVGGHPCVAPSDRGLSPQGNFSLLRNTLVVPCGRSLPAGLDATTGKLIYYNQGVRRGESRVVLDGDYAFVGKDGIMSLNDFREVGSRQPLVPYKLVTGCDASSAFADGVAYGSVNGAFYAYDVGHAKAVERECSDPWGTLLRLLKWEPSVRWQYQTPYAGQLKTRDVIDGRPWGYDASPKSGVTIKAGKSVYGCTGRKLLALDNLGGPPRIAWEQDLDGTPMSLAAADNKLFVATAEGGIYCFGEGAVGKTWDGNPVALEAKTDAAPEKARRLVGASGVTEGYCLVLGLTDGRLTDELLKQTKLLVLAVDADAQKIDALRRRYAAAGLLGSRVELFVAEPLQFLFPPYLASLIVSEDARAAGFSTALDAANVFNLLHPYGGTLCLDLPADLRPKLAAWAKTAATSSAALKQDGDWSLLVREGPLPGSAPWTHGACDVANTFCSQDDLVQAPLGFLWYGDVPMAWPEYPSGFVIKFVVNSGCVYMHVPHSRTFLLTVYDAYTGRPLWKTEMPTRHRRASSAIMNDGIYFVADGKCVVFETKTGRILRTFPFKTTETQVTTDLRVADDIILVTCTEPSDADRAVRYGDYADDISSTLLCLDRQTGAELWRREAKDRLHDKALAVGAGRVFCVDSVAIWKAEKALAKPEDLKEVESTVLALEARTGKELWTQKTRYDCTRTYTQDERNGGPLTADDGHYHRPEANDWLAYSAETDLVLAGRYLRGSAFAAKSGKVRWENREIRGSAPVVLRGKTLVTSGGNVYDLLTGERTGNYKGVRKTNCNYAVASKHLVMIRLDSASYYDVGQDKAYPLRNIRSSCMNNLIAADGLVNSPCFTPGDCVCNYPIQTSFAMVHMPEVEAWSGAAPLAMTPPPVKAPDGSLPKP